MKSAITIPQLKAARALLEWTRETLSEHSGVPLRTLVRLENGQTTPRHATYDAVVSALEAAGVEFIEENGGGPGVRLKKLR